MQHVRLSDDRLTYRQYERLTDIIEYISNPRPELEWGGFKRERRRLSAQQWFDKISRELYVLYRDLYPGDVDFSRDHVEDLFDDKYIDHLTSWRRRFFTWLCS